MTRSNSRRDRLRSLCAEPAEGDGLDPRYEPGESGRKPPGRKALQLCGQAWWALDAALAESHDDVIQALRVVAVAPAPDTGRLLVSLAAAAGEPIDPPDIFARLDRASPRLRTAVAAAITRRKAPTLGFRLVVVG